MLSNEMNGLWTCLVIAMASASIAMTMTQTELFAPLRQWAKKTGHMIGHLFKCFYCMSHWAVIAGIIIYRPVLISSGNMIVDLIVSTFVTITLAAIICGIMFLVFLSAMQKGAKEITNAKLMAEKTVK